MQQTADENSPIANPEKKLTEQILIYRLGSLGDTCVALPALRLVRKRFPSARIVLLTNLPVSDKAVPAISVLERAGLVDDILAYPVGTRNMRRLGALLGELRRRRFDLIINLAAWRGHWPMRRDALFFRLAGAQRYVGFHANESGLLRFAPNGIAEHEAARLLRRVSQFGKMDLNEQDSFELGLTTSERAAAGQRLADAGVEGFFCAVSLGTKVSVNDWGQENWRELLIRLGDSHPQLALVLVGAEAEYDRAEACRLGWPGASANFCGKISPRQSAAVLSLAKCFVGHDSGPMHLAAAVGTRSVAIFAARNPPGQWFPLGEGHRVIYHQTECFGCGLEVCKQHQKKCILSITVDEVISAIKEVLNSDPKLRTSPEAPLLGQA